MCFSYSKPREITRGLKRIWDSKMGTPSSVSIIEANNQLNETKRVLTLMVLPLNGLQDGTPCAVRPVGNSPEFMSLDNSLNRDILYSLCFHCFLSHYIVDGEETTEEESNFCLSFSTPKETARGLKRIWDSKMGTPSSVRIIKDVYLALKTLE